MDRLNNPFTPGAGALPPELAGCAAIIEDGRVLVGRTLLCRYEKSLLPTRLDTNFFDVRFDHISNRGRSFLNAMADCPQDSAIQTNTIASRTGHTIDSGSPVRASLIGIGMIYSPSYGKVACTVPLFADYKKRTMP